MAGRKPEPGISYYRMNCGHTINKKVRLLFNEFDANGYWIWQCIIDYAYSHKGYYFDCNDPDALELFATDVCKKQVSLVNQVISGCLRRGLFDKTVFDMFGVLSSVMMQEIYLDATYERRRKGTEIELFGEFVLINIPADAVNISIVPLNKPILPRKNENVPGRNATDKSIVDESKKDKNIVNSNGVAADKPPPKKSVGKHEKKKEEAEPYWKQLVEVWFDFNTEKFSIKPSFKQQDPKYFKSIILELKKRSAKENVEWTEVVALAIVKKFLCFAHTDPWLQKHFLLKNLSEQFDKIIQLMVAENIPAKKTEDRKLSKDEREINYLYEYYHEGGNIINQMNEEHFELLKKKGLDFTNDEREEIKQATKKYVSENELNLSAEGMKSLQKRFGIIQFFKQQKAKGNVTIFRLD